MTHGAAVCLRDIEFMGGRIVPTTFDSLRISSTESRLDPGWNKKPAPIASRSGQRPAQKENAHEKAQSTPVPFPATCAPVGVAWSSAAPPCFARKTMPAPDIVRLGHATRPPNNFAVDACFHDDTLRPLAHVAVTRT